MIWIIPCTCGENVLVAEQSRICSRCGRLIRAHRPTKSSPYEEYWDGSVDDAERRLEEEISKYGW